MQENPSAIPMHCASRPISVLVLSLALVASGCAPKKAIVVEEAPKKPASKVEEPAIAEVPIQQDPNDGLRGIDDMMLSLPDENDFRATVPVPKPAGSDSNAVISRPPTDPPPRPKPKTEN
jgi:hypothetical protein